MMNLHQDLRVAWRMLVKNPGFTFIAIVSIALGVGANAAMFSVADGLVLRPLPVPRPGDVVTISAVTQDTGFRNSRLSHPEYVDVRDQSRTVEDLVAYTLVITSFANRPDEAVQRRVGMAVSGNLFEAMRVMPAIGRAFRAEEDRVPGRDAVVILDHDEWTQRFGADPTIVDRRLRIGGTEFTVVGVAPARFTGIDHDVHPAFYVPLAMLPTVQSGMDPGALSRRDARMLTVKGRLAPGVSIDRARAEIGQIGERLARAYPGQDRSRTITARTQLEAYGDVTGGSDTGLVGMLVTLALVVLVVACANVASLLASRAPVRAREMALRLAVGAGRARLIRQLMTESVLIAIGGGALGLAAAYGVIVVFQRLEFPTDVPLKLTFELDGRVLAVGITVAALSAILSSLIPAWQSTRVDLVSSLKDSAARSTHTRRLWGRSTLVCGQVALSLVLLTVSVFLYRAFQTELGKGPGFRTNQLLMMAFDPSLARYDASQTREFYRLLTARAREVPGVRSVALTSSVPTKVDTIGFTAVAPEGFAFPSGTRNVSVPWARIDEGYFETMDIPIVAGRGFLPSDTADTPRVAVINQTFAARYWPDGAAIGRRIRLDADEGRFAEIVGIAADSAYFHIVAPRTEFLYLPRTQAPAPQSTLLVHAEGDAAALAGPLREAVRAIDPNMPVYGVRTMEDFYFSRIIHTSRLIVGSAAGMGSMGLVLAMVGLYGLVSYAASRRTREIGVRIAVGAHPAAVLRMVLRHGLVLAACGIAIGVLVSLGAGSLLQSVFPGAAGMGPVPYFVVIPALLAVTLLAAYFPARRAARIDPLMALRQE